MSTAAHHLHSLITHVEKTLSKYYGFDLLFSANDFITPSADTDESAGQGQLVIVPEGDDEAMIGIQYSEMILQQLHAIDPLATLNNDNLNSFCVLIEEISHFHLLTQRMHLQSPISPLELECQGEIDKLLICALTMDAQCGDPNLLPLARQLFDGAKIISPNQELYWQATKYAARFWYSLLRETANHRVLLHSIKLRSRLRQEYWQTRGDRLRQVA